MKKVTLWMAVAQQKKILRPPVETRTPNAENVTSIAISFLKTLGNKRSIKPKKVSLHEQVYTVELDIGKDKTALVQIEVQTREIKEYEIKTKEKEESALSLPFSPKSLILIFGVSVAVYFVLEFLNVSGFLLGR
jgi:phage anti-repressor protein